MSWVRDQNYKDLREENTDTTNRNIVYNKIKELGQCTVVHIMNSLYDDTKEAKWLKRNNVAPRVSELKSPQFGLIKQIGVKIIEGKRHEVYALGKEEKPNILSETELRNVLKKISRANDYQKKIIREACER